MIFKIELYVILQLHYFLKNKLIYVLENRMNFHFFASTDNQWGKAWRSHSIYDNQLYLAAGKFFQECVRLCWGF